MKSQSAPASKRYPAVWLPLVLQNNISLVLFLIILSGFLLRLPNLNESLWGDEVYSTRVVLGKLRSLVYFLLYDIHPPLYYIFMSLWIKLFGDSELFLRLPNLICGTSSIFLVYILASLTTEKNTALLASFLVSVSPVHIWYSLEARSYTILSFLLLLSIISYIKLRYTQANSIWIIIYFSALFSFTLSHFYSIFYVVLISIICLLEMHRKRHRILMLNFVILSCLFIWLVIKFMLPNMNIETGYLRVFTFGELWKLLFNWFLLGNIWNTNLYHWPMLVIQIFFLAILIHGLVLLFKDRDEMKCSRDIVMHLFILPLVLLGFGFIGYGSYIERSLFVMLPFFFIIVAKGVTGLDARSVRYTCMILVIVVSIITVVEYFSRDNEWTVAKPKPDWRSAARYLDSELECSSEQFSIFATNGAGTLPLEYYEPRFKHATVENLQSGHKQSVKFTGILKHIREIYDKIIPPIEEDQNCFKIYTFSDVGEIYNQLFSNNSHTLYLVRNRYTLGGQFDRTFETLMKDSRFQYQDVQSFNKGIEIYKFTQK